MCFMSKINAIFKLCSAVLAAGIVSSAPLYAVQITGSDSKIVIDFPAGWKSSDTDDPDIVLKAEKRNSSFSLTKLNQDLGDYYLKSRIREEMASLRLKGFSIPGDIQRISRHRLTALYHMSYHAAGKSRRTGFFTYNGQSYALSASEIPSREFFRIVATIRAPGEKIIKYRPKKPKPKPAKKPKSQPIRTVQISPAPAPVGSTAPADAEIIAMTTRQAAIVKQPEPEEPAPAAKVKLPPYIERHPIPFYYWVIAGVAWILGAFFSRLSATEIKNPKLAIPPKDIPPDFFFPFIIQRFVSIKELTYTVLSRQKQILYATFNRTHETLIAASFYLLVFFHLFWSIMETAGKGYVITDILLSFPGGRSLASLPEALLFALFIIGLFVWAREKQTIRLMDHHGDLIFEAFPAFGTILIRDGKGKEAGRLKRLSPAFAGRHWQLTDEDNQPVLEIKDEHPKLLLLRRLFGHMGGTFQARYGIFIHERRAGFILRDPASVNRFQVHLEFSFSRIAHHALILICALYVESKDRDPIYPSPL